MYKWKNYMQMNVHVKNANMYDTYREIYPYFTDY
jgi:hypothetical protein